MALYVGVLCTLLLPNSHAVEDTGPSIRLLDSNVQLSSSSWSPDSDELVLSVLSPPGIARISVEDGTKTFLSAGAYNKSPVWSPSDQTVIFLSADGEGGLYEVDASSSNAKKVLLIERSGWLELPSRAWAPGGNKFLYEDQRGLVLFDLSSRKGRVVLPREEARHGFSHWFPGGASLLCHMGASDIVQLDVATGDFTKRAKSNSAWLGMGSDDEIWYRKFLGKNERKVNILIRQDSNDVQREYRFPGTVQQIDVHPKTGRVAVSIEGRGIFVLHAESGEMTQLTTGLTDAEPLWAPDGRRIAFNRTRHGRAELWVVAVGENGG